MLPVMLPVMLCSWNVRFGRNYCIERLTEQVDIIELLHDFSFLIINDNFQLQMSKLYLFFCLNAFLLTRKYDFVTNQVSGLGTN